MQQNQHDQPTQSKDTFKAKLALFFGYNGQHYHGMQYQRNNLTPTHITTIQNTLHDLLYNQGFILSSNTTNLQRIKWSRAARTDKRVHALCNSISAKLQINNKYLKPEDKDNVPMAVLHAPSTKYHLIDYERIVQELNAVMPKDMRLHAIKKVTRNFDCRHDAKCRRYNYLMPAFVFRGWEQIQGGTAQPMEEIEKLVGELNQRVNQQYLKTHNFHNFTRRLKQTDPRCKRHMLSMKVQLLPPAFIAQYCQQHNLTNPKNIQFLRFQLLGQSFVYHQIRKMIGLLVQMKVQNHDDSVFQKAFSMQKFKVFLAPGQGLYLNQVTFDNYNLKKDIPEKLVFNEEERQRVEVFRRELEGVILGHEFKESVFTKWVAAYYGEGGDKEGEEEGEGEGSQEGGDDKDD